VRGEIEHAYRDGPVPAPLQPLLDEPRTAIPALATLVRTYFDRALAPHWPRIRTVVEGDVLHRARRLADGGARHLFADIDPSVRWSDGVLEVTKRADQDVDLSDRGLLFVPSVFGWPRVVIVTAPPWQPTIIYPARGAGALWEPAGAARNDALGALLGHNRATLLLALDRPRSTTDLAALAGITPAASRSTSGCCAPPGWSPRTGSGARCSTCAPRRATPSWPPRADRGFRLPGAFAPQAPLGTFGDVTGRAMTAARTAGSRRACSTRPPSGCRCAPRGELLVAGLHRDLLRRRRRRRR
jgi:hypothetical protein